MKSGSKPIGADRPGAAGWLAARLLRAARSEFGPPGLGRLPYISRGPRNVGYGRSAVSGRVTASVRIIDLREEEYRQTGYRSP